ncbi:hypothetical protein BUALT_Bualt11G0039800 [Buddleja alternifolia]|uniref:DNA mismatch repair protein MLH3 n=1 Tax=Buddleja alternifolia TaxID=168488 RepID=A0AAV6WRD5_9LAMI|nr:hypothetical protein BUALT_Bualt11G0039800 [Buddleja alternifolia]
MREGEAGWGDLLQKGFTAINPPLSLSLSTKVYSANLVKPKPKPKPFRRRKSDLPRVRLPPRRRPPPSPPQHGMRSIERLPEAIHSSVRSEVVICDFTRIVEELVFNSLDAGATKVSVAVGVSSCYVKVMDNGSGITRDGLVLLGERYATSKIDHNESFDFHGETLCSISDVSLLEIVTKARGKPNGYRKIMKNCKCLFLGINDDRQDVGTTVTVRDIFDNQPVRRKHMECSPKKVLDSIKMSVLRIALVHVDVLFKVVDVESGDELLHTKPSLSPLPILFSNFGIENSGAFYELNVSDGELKLSGYISDPREIFSSKAIQYVYINSRFICKGQIHKLLNQLAAKFELSNSWQPAPVFVSEKGNKCDVCPTFILNLYCPRSYYDVIPSERSRTLVEFKDWGPVLAFVENGVMRLWAENISHGKYVRGTFESGKSKCRKQNCQTSLDLRSSKQKKLCQDYENMPAWEECGFSCGKPSTKVSELNKHQIGAGLLSETDYLSRSCDESLAGYRLTINRESSSHLSPCSVFSPAHHQFVASRDGRQQDRISSLVLKDILPTFDDDIDNISIERGISVDCLKYIDDMNINQDPRKSFLRSCSFERELLHCRKSPASDEVFEYGGDEVYKKEWVDHDGIMVDEIDLVICGKDLQCNEKTPFQSSPLIKYDLLGRSESPVRDSVKFPLILKNNLSDSKQVWKCSSSQQSFRSGWSPTRAEQNIGINFQVDDNDSVYKSYVEGYSEFGKDTIRGYFAHREDEDLTYSNLNIKESWQQQKCSVVNFFPNPKGCPIRKREIGEVHLGEFENLFSPKPFKRFSETDWSPLPSYGKESPINYSVPSFYDTPPTEHECGRSDSRNLEMRFNRKKSSVRSHSAPPFYEGKTRYLNLTDSSNVLSAKINFQNIRTTLSSTKYSNSNHAQLHAESRNVKCVPSPTKESVVDCSVYKRPGLEVTPEVVTIQNGRSRKKDQCINVEPVDCLDLKEIQDSFHTGEKWRDCCLPTAGRSIRHDYKNQEIILDISSDILLFAGDSLVPKSIDRASLADAKVLNQVDKKFIAVVAGKTLAIIDQHAADERIKLEELRHKVLSGEMKTITYLDDGRDLVLPEIGYQLLHNYAEQIQTWGWICNIHCQETSSFTKHLDFLHKKSTAIKLLAVPCILGVNLTDTDLLEFLQQLADTDGSSNIPPSVHRLLNNKACRGAIMFGDTLLPSECSLIVEELKRTSLCFQCAHGRPTTVPLLDLDLLHNKIAKHASHGPWHGLCQHKFSLKRSTNRLSSALS